MRRWSDERGQADMPGLSLAFLAAGGLLALAWFLVSVLAAALNLTVGNQEAVLSQVQAAAQYAAEQVNLGNFAAASAGGVDVRISPGRSRAAFLQAMSITTGFPGDGGGQLFPGSNRWFGGPLSVLGMQTYQWSDVGNRLPDGEPVSWPGVWVQVAVPLRLPRILPFFGQTVVEPIAAYAPSNALDLTKRQLNYLPAGPPPNMPPIPVPPPVRPSTSVGP